MILKEASLLETIASKLHASIHIYIFVSIKQQKQQSKSSKVPKLFPELGIEISW